MAVFDYKGIGASGRSVRGVRDADSAKALRGLLRKEGIFLTEVLGEAAAKARAAREINFRRLFQRITAMDVAIATRQLATLTGAGIPLVESLSAVIDQVDHAELKRIFTEVRERVTEGSSFADALSAHPDLFPNLYVNMVNAGEQSGTLEAVLDRLADFTEANVKLKNKVFSAMAYPVLMLCLGILIISIMMIVVVPKVTAIFEDFGHSLPWYTRLLIFVSNTVSSWMFWAIFLPLFLGGAFAFSAWRRTPAGRIRWDRFKLRVPIFGKLVMMLSVSRFSKTLATLLSSGVPLLKAMDITKSVLGNLDLQRVLEEASTSIREGESIAEPLKRSGRFPPIVTHMIAIGERSGQLEPMLENIGRTYDNQIETRLTVLTSLLEPIMILLMGGMAGGIAFSILMPLLQLNEFVR